MEKYIILLRLKKNSGFGYKFKTTSDTEVLLLAYHKWGVDCQQKFNGMWAFAIFDQKKNEIFISRDRFGKTLILFKHKRKILFCLRIEVFYAYRKKHVPILIIAI